MGGDYRRFGDDTCPGTGISAGNGQVRGSSVPLPPVTHPHQGHLEHLICLSPGPPLPWAKAPERKSC